MTLVPQHIILQSPASNDPLLDLNTQPSLDLQFATGKTLNDRVSGNNLITFSRADATTCATYVDSNGVIQTAAANVPRFDHDPVTGESLGLLIEESRTNEIYNSNAKVYQTGQPFTSVGNIWQSCSNPSQGIITNISTTSEVGPDGLSGVTKVAPEAGISYDLVDFTVTDGFQVGFTYTGNLKAITGFFKPSGCDILNVRWGNYSTARAVYTFNASTLVVTGSDASIVALANGWFKFQITNSARQSLTFGCSKSNGDPNNGVDGVLFWGVQSEDNVSFPTSYIPTSASAVTRAADVASITGANFSSWHNNSASTLYIESPSFPEYSKVSNGAFIYISDVAVFSIGTGDGIKFGTGSPSTNTRLFVTEGATNVSLFNNAPGTKFAFGLTAGDLAGAIDGSIVGTDNTAVMPTGMDRLVMTPYSSGYAHISRLTYYPYRLADATLQEITS